MKRTWQPKKLPRLRKHGYLKLMSKESTRKIINRRRAKGRKQLTVSDEMRKFLKKPRNNRR